MPAQRTNLHAEGHFVAVEGDSSVWKCLPCSKAAAGKVTVFKRNNIRRHIDSTKHKEATTIRHEAPAVMQHRSEVPPAVMSLPKAFSTSEVHESVHVNHNVPSFNPFEYAQANIDSGCYIDQDSHEIVFSTGISSEEDEQTRLRADLEALLRNPFIEHDDWGARAAGIIPDDEFADEAEANPTVAGAVADLHLAGLVEEDEDDNDDFDMDLGREQPESDPLWHPYESKTFLPRVEAPVAEFFDGTKCLDMNEAALDHNQLMWMDAKNAPDRHFYIKELARLQDGRFVIPLRFIQEKDEDCFDGYQVVPYPATGIFVVRDDKLIRGRARELKDSVVEILREQEHIRFNDLAPSWVLNGQHPVRVTAAKRPTYTIRLMTWSDDVSGNKTKQFNAHTNVYVVNVNLPHKKRKQEYFVRFCSTLQHASSSEQLEILAKDTGPERWHTAYDCELGQEVLFRIIPHVFPADNPQQSEHTSHIGGNGNKPCRACKIGGSAPERESDEKYDSFFSPGPPRTAEDTINEIHSQLWAAGLGVQNMVDHMQTQSGIKDKTAQYWIDILIKKARAMQHERITAAATRDPRLNDSHLDRDAKQAMKTTVMGEIQQELHDWLVQQPPRNFAELPPDSSARKTLRPGDHYNILLGLPGVEIHLDTPGEILHTFLLGQEKYVWHKTSAGWDKKKDELFAARLRSSSVDGLSLPPIRAEYLVKYKNALVGKHFKALQQVGAFHLYDDLCPEIVQDLWKATGELGAVLWFHQIRDMNQYLDDLEVLVANVLDIWAIIDPNRILTKNKLHILMHLVNNIHHFGPAILYSTEIFECWNAIFRFCSILSNHQAPSRDIAVTLADMERFKHQVSGGWWRNSVGEYVCAGNNIQIFFRENLAFQCRLGWVDHTVSSMTVGTVKLEARLKRQPSVWSAQVAPLTAVTAPSITEPTQAAAAPGNSPYDGANLWQCCVEQ
ncbi:hypothetical protein C8Q72DRAFT_928484 [Fomitopsis betulina]|nr:hypothetical protein C8Q72DRAFT_928484 [Fomitopsis betulina]